MDVEVRIYIVGVRGEEVARIGVWVLFQRVLQVLQRLPVGLTGHLDMFAKSLVCRSVFFLMVAAAVEDYEAAFAGVETRFGLAYCALIFLRERSGGRHLGWIVGGRKRLSSISGQVSWVKKIRCRICCGDVGIELALSRKNVFISLCMHGLSTCTTVDAAEHQVFIRWYTSDANAMQLRCIMALRRK